jgi:hypothetical protein
MPADGPHGIRYGGSVIRIWAIVWNVGICRCNAKGVNTGAKMDHDSGAKGYHLMSRGKVLVLE